MKDFGESKPYESARDLPSFREMERMYSGTRLLLAVPFHKKNRELKQQITEAKVQLDEIAQTVDKFYELLGDRNWIFTNELKMDAMKQLVALSSSDAAEATLIEYFKTEHHLEFNVGRLWRFEAMRPRIHLIEKALDDYEHGRYYSVVLVLIAVMDGFVNDIDKQTRRGLHAREEDELFSWDSVSGHHMGLTNAHRSFIKSVKKTVSEEVRDLHRNGIVHGMITNFDNVYVATKAWNRLFAIADWADSQKEHSKQLAKPPEPSLFRTLMEYAELQKDIKRADQFVKHDCSPGQDDCLVIDAASDFLERWQKQQWAPLVKHFMQFGSLRHSLSVQIQDAKILYQDFPLESSSIVRARHLGAAAAEVDVLLHIEGQAHKVSLEWKHVGDDGKIAYDWLEGNWILSPYGPTVFLDRK